MNSLTRKKAVPLKLIIIGGGYAGLSALITLRKQAPDAEITLIDPRPYHLIITRLHETVHRPLDAIRVSYSLLAKRFGFIHKQQAIHFDEHQLRIWNSKKIIQLGEENLPFDYLLITTGSLPIQSVTDPDVYDLNAISQHCFSTILEQFIASTDANDKTINIVGAGPTGIQFAFEMAHVLLACHADYQLNLIEGSDKLLAPFPSAISRYVEKRLFEKRITLHKNQFYKGKQGREILLENSHSGDKSAHASDLTLLLLGKKPELLLHANSSGQVVLDRKVLTHIFTAGDCSYYDDFGSNLMTSQSALRKGKAAANNILREAGMLCFCLPYMHQDIGYLLSLGPDDGVGWVGSKNAIVSGLPAFIAKEGIEAQYDLLLSGIDSYVF
ncbi:MAG: NADH dehydrogenase [Methylococcaceae bacterium NSM2-1]|nr:MAG: NADH dehydrogenase [Methylococcaceae bacterium NSM2-1]